MIDRQHGGWKRALFGAVCAGALGLGACESGPPIVDEPDEKITERGYVEQADRLIEEGRDGEALALLALAIERNPELTVAHLKIGDIHREQGDYDAASRAYERAAETDLRNFSAHYSHGLMRHILNDYTGAIRAYLKALTIDPDDFSANLNIASAYMEMREARAALPFAQRAVRANPLMGEARAALGSIYQTLARHEEAVREYEAAAELMDLTPELLMNMAQSLGRLKRYEEMANTIEAAIRMEPSAAAHERLGYAYFKMRRYDEAKDQFRRSLEFNGVYYPALNGLGVSLLNQYLLSDKQDEDAREEAIGLLQKSLRVKNEQPRIVELVSRFG